jgi:hypothetical protein
LPRAAFNFFRQVSRQQKARLITKKDSRRVFDFFKSMRWFLSVDEPGEIERPTNQERFDRSQATNLSGQRRGAASVLPISCQ